MSESFPTWVSEEQISGSAQSHRTSQHPWLHGASPGVFREVLGYTGLGLHNFTRFCVSAQKHARGHQQCYQSVMASSLADTNASLSSKIDIGVLALQGAFREHIAHFSKVPGVNALEVRKKEDLDGLDGLVIPGGRCSLRVANAYRL